MNSDDTSAEFSESERALFQATDGLVPRICPSLSQVIGCPDPGFGRLIGTASFLQLRNGIFLLTAAHVARQVSKYPIRAFSKRSHEIIDGTNLPFIFHPNRDYDLAAWAINATSAEILPAQSIVKEDFNSESGDLADILVMAGYPGKFSRYTSFGEILSSTIQPYGTVQGISELPFYDPRCHFVIEYPLEGQKTSKGDPVELPPPRGYSGSLIWKSNRVARSSEDWQASDARIVGLVHTWDPEKQSLLATRVLHPV